MESRLPKPKFVLNKVLATVDTNAKHNNPRVTRKVKNNITASTSSTDTRTANENKAPNKQALIRAKTLSMITTANNTKAVKRTATVISHGETKKALVKPVGRSVAPAQNRTNNTLTSNSRTNRVVHNNNTTENKTGKVKKWDLQGRLAQAIDKLSVAQQKGKDIESKCTSLEELVNNLRTSEDECRTKAEKLQNTNNALNNELESLTTEVSILRRNEQDLAGRLKESEESCTSISRTLNEFQEKCTAQETLNAEQARQLTVLKVDLDSQRKTNEDLTTINEKLQSLMYKMDKERRVLHNNIQELKGNIRVFCRVRPRTAKEIEEMKA
jgi:kinesin family protein C1